MGQIEYSANHWSRVFDIDDFLTIATVRQKEPLSRKITIRMESEIELSQEQQTRVRDLVRYEIDADSTLDTLRQIQDDDILTKLALKNSAGLRLYANSNTVEVAIASMIQQNVEYTTYLEIMWELVVKHGTKVPWADHLYLFPDNETIASLGIDDWKSLGVGLKAKYLAALREHDLKNIHQYAYYPVYERGIDGLKQIKGIGDYTARVIMIYGARRYDKAILDGYIQEILDHKYKLHQVLPLSEFDKWIAQRWPTDPALVLHAHIQDYLPAYIKEFDFDQLYQAE